MRLTTLAGSIAVLTQGLIAGIFISILATRPARISLDTSSFVQHQQAIHIVYGRMMPPLVIVAIIAGIVWLFFLRKRFRSAGFLFAAISTVCAMVAFALTVTVNFPLNDLLMTWNAASPPADVKELWMPWESAHTIRTVIYVIGFISAIAGINMSRDRE